LIKKALGYDYEEKKVYTKTENGQAVTYTEITKKHQPPDTGALFGLLKNKDPEHYSDNPQMLQLKKQELELQRKTGQRRQLVMARYKTLSDFYKSPEWIT
jgi:hypothetical protein